LPNSCGPLRERSGASVRGVHVAPAQREIAVGTAAGPSGPVHFTSMYAWSVATSGMSKFTRRTLLPAGIWTP
jgi:hypothetical protein